MKTKLRVLLVVAIVAMCAVTSMAQLTKGFRGKVIGTDGKPAVGATVTFVNLDETSQTWHVKTDKNGYYTQAGLPYSDKGYDIRVKTDKISSKPKVEKSFLMKLTVINFDLREDAAELKKKIAASAAAEAKKLFGMEDYEGALTKANEAIVAKDNVQAALFIKAASLEKLGNVDGAIEAFESYNSKYPDNPNSVNILGSLAKLYEQKGDKSKASFYEKAFKAKGGEVIGETYNQGVKAFESGDYKTAAGLFRKAMKETPNDPDCHRSLARCLVQLGDYQGTISELETYLKMKPNADDAATWKQAIAGLKAMIAAQNKKK